MSAILRFYRGEGTDAQGRTLAEILAWDDARLEAVHDYIQWLFPLAEPSAFNADAPLLTDEDIAAFRADSSLQATLSASFQRMLQFYGFEQGGRVQPSANHALRVGKWATPGNHNFLRITRILRCLHLLGLEAQAAAFLTALGVLHAGDAGRTIGLRTLDFWRGAVQQDRNWKRNRGERPRAEADCPKRRQR